MRILIGSYVLYDSALLPGAALSAFSPDWQRAIQVVEPVRAAEITTIYRGLVRNNFAFTISRQHSSEDEVLSFLAFHQADIPTSGVIRIIGLTAAGAERTSYFAGSVESGRGRHIGHRSFMDYRIIAGAAHKTSPV